MPVELVVVTIGDGSRSGQTQVTAVGVAVVVGVG